MNAVVLSLLLAAQVASSRFDLACALRTDDGERAMVYSVDLESGEWCQRPVTDAASPCPADDRREIAMAQGRYLLMWADDSGYQAVSLDTGFLSGATQGDGGEDWQGHCRPAPFTGWSPAR